MRKLLLGIFIVLLSACAEPLPQSKLKYAGLWEGNKVSLLIYEDGNVSYRRVSGNTKVSIDGPIKGFDGDNFSVGVGFLATDFKVTVPPQLINEQWEMVVDGVRLVKAEN